VRIPHATDEEHGDAEVARRTPKADVEILGQPTVNADDVDVPIAGVEVLDASAEPTDQRTSLRGRRERQGPRAGYATAERVVR
jgi:hypothetical protein